MHTLGSSNPADGPSRRPHYATDVPQPSGSLLRLLVFQSYPPPDPSAQVFRMLASLSVFTPDKRSSMRTTPIGLLRPRNSRLRGYQWRNDLLLYKSRIYVPCSIRLDVLRVHLTILSLLTLVSPELQNSCHAITGSPPCPPLSKSTCQPAISVLVVNRRAISKMED